MAGSCHSNFSICSTVQKFIKFNENILSIFHNKEKKSGNDAKEVMNLDSLFMSTYEKSYQNTL